MKLEEAVALIESSATLDELKASLHRIAADYGFASFNFMDTGRPGIDMPFYMGTTGEKWETAYKDNLFVHIDPYLAKARRHNTPFDWASISMPPVKKGPRAGVLRLMDAAFSFGFQEGLIVPYHFKDNLGRIHSAMCAFYWQDDGRQFGRRMEEIHAHLHLVVIYFMQKVVDLLAVEKRKAPEIFRGSKEDKSVLTDRERDVLSWAARGKTSSETATILGCSELTVETHVRNALGKLSVTNKTHAVAKSITLGLIDF